MTKYRNIEVERTQTIHTNTGRRLYALKGEVTKPAAQRPFLTTLREAKDYIDGELDGFEWA